MTSSNTLRSTTEVERIATFVSFAGGPPKSEYISTYALPAAIALIAAVMFGTCEDTTRSADERVPPNASKNGQYSIEPGGGHSWNMTGPGLAGLPKWIAARP